MEDPMPFLKYVAGIAAAVVLILFAANAAFDQAVQLLPHPPY